MGDHGTQVLLQEVGELLTMGKNVMTSGTTRGVKLASAVLKRLIFFVTSVMTTRRA